MLVYRSVMVYYWLYHIRTEARSSVVELYLICFRSLGDMEKGFLKGPGNIWSSNDLTTQVLPQKQLSRNGWSIQKKNTLSLHKRLPWFHLEEKSNKTTVLSRYGALWGPRCPCLSVCLECFPLDLHWLLVGPSNHGEFPRQDFAVGISPPCFTTPEAIPMNIPMIF